jgi:type II secretory pathway pseudopilin PulG
MKKKSAKNKEKVKTALKKKAKALATKENVVMLLIVCVLLAAVIIRAPFALKKEAESKTWRNARYMQNAISIYYGDHAGNWPQSAADIVPSNIEKILPELIKKKDTFKVIEEKIEVDVKANTEPAFITGEGGWVFLPQTGGFFLNVKGKDSKGKEYWKYGYE